MSATPFLPPLPDTWEATRATLHAYSHAATAVNRVHGTAHPKWWHVSLKVEPDGLATDPVPLPDGGTAGVRLDLLAGAVVFETSDGERTELDMTAGTTGTEMADAIIARYADRGLTGDYDRSKFRNDDPRSYDAAAAAAFWRAETNVAAVFERHRSSLGGEVGIVQLWPHNFDTSVEWFGTRVETYTEDGETTEYPSQLNLGFYPGGDRPYFYSNPWPFEESLVDSELPHGAAWHTEGWQGTILHYDQLAGDPDAERKLADYAAAVFRLASPTLTA